MMQMNLFWPGSARRGEARLGAAGRGKARQGKARQTRDARAVTAQ